MITISQNKTWKLGGKLTIHRFGYGAMRITGEGMLGQPKDKPEAIRVLKKAVDSGVDFIDTADSYGPNVSEEIIAEALYPYPKGLVLATKGGQLRPGPDQWIPDGRPEHLKEVLHGSLERLKLDKIKLYQLHRRDPKVPFDETLGYLKEAQDQGLIEYFGLSELDAKSVKEAQKILPVVSLQNKFSLDYRKWTAEVDFCNQHNIAFIPWNPINAGNLAQNETLNKIAQNHQASVYQIGLIWLFNFAPNILLIPGTSKVAHLEENLAAQNIQLTNEEFERLNQLTF